LTQFQHAEAYIVYIYNETWILQFNREMKLTRTMQKLSKNSRRILLNTPLWLTLGLTPP